MPDCDEQLAGDGVAALMAVAASPEVMRLGKAPKTADIGFLLADPGLELCHHFLPVRVRPGS